MTAGNLKKMVWQLQREKHILSSATFSVLSMISVLLYTLMTVRNMGLVATKPAFGVSDIARLKPVSSATRKVKFRL